ncbi:MAG: phosphatase PAP2 family protein [Planctomycetaceae bacterium]
MSVTPEWAPPTGTTSGWGVPLVLLLLAAVSVFTVDDSLSRSATEQGWNDEVHEALRSIEPFGNPYGMAAILLAIVAMAPDNLMTACRIGTTGVASGLSAGAVKLLICRARPHHFDFDHGTALDSFQGLFPLMSTGGGWQSFPSAHTATAVAFAVALVRRFPHARWLCYSLAVLVGVQRIESGQHFASDVFAGAAVGWIIARLVLAVWQDCAQTACVP